MSFSNHSTCWTGVRKDNMVSDPPRQLPGTWLSLPSPTSTHTSPCSGISESSLALWIQAKGWQLVSVPGCLRPPAPTASSRTGSYLAGIVLPCLFSISPPQFSPGNAIHGSPCGGFRFLSLFGPLMVLWEFVPSTEFFLSSGQASRSFIACGVY